MAEANLDHRYVHVNVAHMSCKITRRRDLDGDTLRAANVSEIGRAGAALVAVILAGAIPTGALAYEVRGQGTMSCGEWLQDRQLKDPSEQDVIRGDESWVLGFITGVNAASSSDAGNQSEAAGMFAWIDNYCRTHPLAQLVGATEQLWFSLNKAIK